MNEPMPGVDGSEPPAAPLVCRPEPPSTLLRVEALEGDGGALLALPGVPGTLYSDGSGVLPPWPPGAFGTSACIPTVQ